MKKCCWQRPIKQLYKLRWISIFSTWEKDENGHVFQAEAPGHPPSDVNVDGSEIWSEPRNSHQPILEDSREPYLCLQVLPSSTKSLPKKFWGEKIQQKLHFKNSLTASRAHRSFYLTTPCETVGFPPDVNRGLPIPWTGWRKKSLANLPLRGLQGNVLIAIIVEWVLSSPKSSMGNPIFSFICPIQIKKWQTLWVRYRTISSYMERYRFNWWTPVEKGNVANTSARSSVKLQTKPAWIPHCNDKTSCSQTSSVMLFDVGALHHSAFGECPA